MASYFAGFAEGQWVKGEVEGRGTLTYGVKLSRFEPAVNGSEHQNQRRVQCDARMVISNTSDS